MSAFTPGPWQAKHDYDVEGATTIIANVDGEIHPDGAQTYSYDFICACEDEYGERLPNAQANARLIRAAPELYTLLEELVDIEGPQPGTATWAKKVDAALAKVRGEQP